MKINQKLGSVKSRAVEPAAQAHSTHTRTQTPGVRAPVPPQLRAPAGARSSQQRPRGSWRGGGGTGPPARPELRHSDQRWGTRRGRRPRQARGGPPRPPRPRALPGAPRAPSARAAGTSRALQGDRLGRGREARAGHPFPGACAADGAGPWAATAKRSGAAGPLCVAEAERLPAPGARRLPRLRSRCAPSAREGLSPPAARGLPPRGGGGPNFKRDPPKSLRAPPPLLPAPENQTPPVQPGEPSRNPHLRAVPRGRRAPRNLLNVASQAGALAGPRVGPPGRAPRAARCPLTAPGTPPGTRGLRGQGVCLRSPLSELILTRSSCVPELSEFHWGRSCHA